MRTIALLLLLVAPFTQGVGQERLKSANPIPIVYFGAVPQSESTLERFQELQQTGVTLALTHYKNKEEVLKGLDLAQKVGIKMILSCPELKKEPEQTVKFFKNHPALGGYFIIDEPNQKLFHELGTWVKRIQAVDSEHFCYANLFPNYADTVQLGSKNYTEHVTKYLQEIPLPIISFDYYPCSTYPKVVNGWYDNLELIAREAKKLNKPFWAFALTALYDNSQPVPSMATFRYQMYTNLAYGAQGLQYYTYWSTEGHRNGPIDFDGKRSAVYDHIKAMNEEIQRLAGVFSGAKVVSIGHLGSNREPWGTKRFTKLPNAIHVLETGGAPALVSVLKREDQTFLVVVNNDYKNPMNLTLFGEPGVKKVLKDGTLIPASVYSTTIAVDPGDAAIYLLPE